MIRFAAILFTAVVAFPAMAADPPHDTSDACLQCHGSKPDVPMMKTLHPYAVEYSSIASSNPSRYRAPSAPSGLGGTVSQDVLFEGGLECASCHIPHGETTENEFRLRTRDLVKLCTACHILER